MQLFRYSIILIAATMVVPAQTSKGTPIHSIPYGYNLSIPPDWTGIPSEVVRTTVSALQNPGAKYTLIYDAAFQPKANAEWFDYPYVIVEVVPYEDLGVHRQINEDEFPEVIKAMTGVDFGKLMDSELSPQAKALMKESNFGRPQLEMERRRYLLPISMSVTGVGKVRGMLAGYFGRQCLVQVGFYARDADWDRQALSGRAILDSFRFDPGTDYSVTVAAANPAERSIWSRGAETGVAAVIGGVIAGFVAMFRKRKPPASPGQC